MPTKKLAVGDIVTWRKAAKPGSTFEPLGVAGCKIIRFGEAEDGRPTAMIEAMGQQMGAYLDDLHLEEPSK